MHRPRFTYVLSVMTFLAVTCWMSVRSYDSIMGQIYYGPLKGFFANAFHLGGGQASYTGIRTKVALLRPSMSPGRYGDPAGPIAAWKRLLTHDGIEFEIIDSKALATGPLGACNVLIVPYAPQLSDADIAAIKAFVSEKGHGLILSGAVGSFKESGDWRDISLAAEIVGGEQLKEVPAVRGGLASMVLDGRNPMTANIPPGLRVGVNMYDRPVSLHPVEPRVRAAAYWIEKGRGFDPDSSGASIINGTYRGGRFVWTGFTQGSAVNPFGVKAAEILAKNMLTYVSFKPIFAKESWPGGKQAAVVFSVETEAPLTHAAQAAEFFSSQHAACTFFCALDAAAANPAALKAILAHPGLEIALQSSPSLRLRNPRSLREAKKMLEAAAGRPVRGMSAPEASGDPAAMKTMLETGYSYVATDALDDGPPLITESYRPHLLSFGRNLEFLVKIPQAGKGKGLFASDSTEGPDAILERMEREFDAVYRVGGFYRVSLSAAALADPKHAEVLSDFLEYVRKKNVWLASLAEAADWSKRWLLVDIDSAKITDVRSNLTVTNSSSQTIDSLRVNLFLPDDAASIEASSERMGGNIQVIARQSRSAILEIRGLRGEGLVFLIDTSAADEN